MLPNPRTLAWYRAFLNAASAYGLKCMAVLSTPPIAVLRLGRSEKLQCWCRFVETVAAELGTQCNGYQLMNEPNNPVYKFFALEDVPSAFVRGASIVRSVNPEATVSINVTMELWGWRTYLADVLRLSGRSIDIVGVDHYPGTWTVGIRQNRWNEVIQIADIIASAPVGSPWFNRRLAIIETGFSTNAIMRDQERQSEYFQNLTRVAKNLKRKSVGDGVLLGVYELCDGDSSAWFDPEAHFGVLNSVDSIRRPSDNRLDRSMVRRASRHIGSRARLTPRRVCLLFRYTKQSDQKAETLSYKRRAVVAVIRSYSIVLLRCGSSSSAGFSDARSSMLNHLEWLGHKER
jgi:hypothetical protein